MTTMTKTTKKSLNSYNQQQLKLICDNLCDNIEELFDHFNLEYKGTGRMYTMACPIHGGDNQGALNFYHTGDNYRGNWACRTHGCEKTFKSSVIGFIRGLISVDKYNWSPGERDNLCPFGEAVQFGLDFLNKDLKDFKVSKTLQEKNRFSQIVEKITNKSDSDLPKIERKYAIAALEIPAQYYIDRGYSKDILNKYDIGLCNKQGKEMYGRVVAPIYSDDHRFVVGCTGRSIYHKCTKCSGYHEPEMTCPNSDDVWKFPKWKHNSGFKSQNHLYNFWFAKDHILKSGVAIIVESPGNVWKLEENNIHNSVAIFGCSLSDRQKIMLDSSGAMNLVILTDNDEAGKNAAIQIKHKCQKTYRIFMPEISKPDIAEMTNEEIKTEIVDFMEKNL